MIPLEGRVRKPREGFIMLMDDPSLLAEIFNLEILSYFPFLDSR
jgi:hypothetical protein